MVKALDVAKMFLFWAKEDGDIITNLKLQKLLYYAQAWHLVNYGRRLFMDEIEAWDFGPVVKTIYHKWKKYGSTPIPYEITGKEADQFSEPKLKFLQELYRIYSNFSATQLVSMTHGEKPWKESFNKGQNVVISTKLMKEYYSELYDKQYGKEG